MILKHGDLSPACFPHPERDPAMSGFSCCFRLADVGTFLDDVPAAGIPEQATGRPRARRPTREARDSVVGAPIDPDGSPIRLIETEDQARIRCCRRDRAVPQPEARAMRRMPHRRLPCVRSVSSAVHDTVNAGADDECPENARGCA
ncbi:hypothetical protein HR51_25255 [Burkholderia cepacia]|nr:hypothetical protein HR51_25255 [Burkholderia cepacia]